MSQCLSCGTTLTQGETTCEACGRLLAGTRRVAEEPLQGEAVLVYQLLASAGFHPVLAWLDDSGQPHPISVEGAGVPAMGLLPPVTNPYAVFVPEDEADEAAQVLQDARRGGIAANDEPSVS